MTILNDFVQMIVRADLTVYNCPLPYTVYDGTFFHQLTRIEVNQEEENAIAMKRAYTIYLPLRHKQIYA